MTTSADPARVPDDLHELLAFDDPMERRSWVFDVTFLESAWTCIYGRGCKGISETDTTHLMRGCCEHGAHLIDKADRKNLKERAKDLRADQWQFIHFAEAKGITKKNDDGVHVTRVVDGACIFLNRPGHPSGAGCALHQAALEADERPLDWKPEVCWQVPLRRIDDTDPYGHVTTTIREWKRRDWGDGGDEFHWWCTTAPEARIGTRPVWEEMADELRMMCGDNVFEMLAAALRARRRTPRGRARAVAVTKRPPTA